MQATSFSYVIVFGCYGAPLERAVATNTNVHSSPRANTRRKFATPKQRAKLDATIATPQTEQKRQNS
jgi:hypothetical protein